MRTDSPIRDKDNDILDRYDFAIDITNGLLKTFQTGQDSITIGVNGEWGSGKSTILEFIESEIKEQTKDEPQRKNIIFRFNPWLFTGQADLQKSFLTQLGIHLRTINPELKSLSEDIILISSIIEIANVLNPDIISRSFIGGGSKIVQKIAKRIGQEPSLQSLKERIDKVLEESSMKVFVIIDDIDRLIPSEIANIFRLVNLNANFKNTFFFLSYDKNVVITALDSEYKINGEQYLEKIIQLDYSIPKLTPELLERLFLENFNQLSSDQKIAFSNKEFNRLWNIGLSEYFSNLRHIYRYFNAVEIRFPAIKNDTNIIDFSVIEAIRIFDYSAFEWIYKNKESLIQTNQVLLRAGVSDDEKQSLLEFIQKNKELNAKKSTEFLINFIFKSIHLSEVVIAFDEKDIDQEKLEREKRIAHKDFFEHYFSFKISINNISQITINNFIKANSEKRVELLSDFKNTKLSMFLKRVFYSLNNTETTNGIIPFILNYSDVENLYLVEADENRFDGLTIIIAFLNDIGNKYGFDSYLNEILANHQSYSRFYLMAYLRNRINGSSNIEPVKFFPEDLIMEKKEVIIDGFKASLDFFSTEYLERPIEKDINVINNILRLNYEVNKELYLKTIDKYLSDTECALILFRCSVTTLTNPSGVSYSIQNDKFILPELTIDKLNKVLGKISIDKYNGTNKDFLKVFQKLKEREFNPYYHYTIDLKEIEF